MTFYVKGFKIDREKIAQVLGAGHIYDPLVEAGIAELVEGLNRKGYLRILTAYNSESPGSDGFRHLVLIIALQISENKDELKAKPLGKIDKTISDAHPHLLVEPDIWEMN
jgi:hypothetical protein